MAFPLARLSDERRHRVITPITIDAWFARLHEETRQSRIRRGRDPETGELLKPVAALRSDLTAKERAEALRIGRIGFASAGARRKAA